MLNINKVIDALESEQYGFSMHLWHNCDDGSDPSCGTVACIGGTTELLMLEAGVPMRVETDDGDEYEFLSAFRWITEGIDLKNPYNYTVLEYAHQLFLPRTDTACWTATEDADTYITRARAIDVLKHLRDTGEISWDFSG